MTTLELANSIKAASHTINTAPTAQKDKALIAIMKSLVENTDAILRENKRDLEKAKSNGIEGPMLDRLMLTAARVSDMASSINEIVHMNDPVGQVIQGSNRPNGMKIEKIRVPLGVIGIIFESRPNVSVDTATLCLKSGNAVMLRGGKEAFHSNSILVKIMQDAVKDAGLDPNIIGLVSDTSRESAKEMMQLYGVLDVLIPRGGAGLIKSVVENAKVPVIETGTGNCHIYIDEYADPKMALEIAYTSKTSRPSVCNSAESLVVHEKIATDFLPKLKKRFDAAGVSLCGCEKAKAILNDIDNANKEDFAKEFLDYRMSIKIVSSLKEAMEHISKYSTGHSESIITNDINNAQEFLNKIDSAAVYVNASTRFTDGGEFGCGAEIGISTQKLHARGPMGLNELTSQKFIIYGKGQVK